MRFVFIMASTAFWLAILGFSSSQLWLPVDEGAPRRTTVDDARHSLAEIARHDKEGDCWMAIDGQVYDLSRYLPEHPSEPEVLLAWCGREASHAYQTKDKGRAHSARADRLLAEYRIATLLLP